MGELAEADLANNNVEDALDFTVKDPETSNHLPYHHKLDFDAASKFYRFDHLTSMEESNCTTNLDFDLETSRMSTTSDGVDYVSDQYHDALDTPSHDPQAMDETINEHFTDASECPSLSYVIADANSRLTNLPDDSEPLSLWSATIQESEEFLDDSPSDFNQYVMSVLEYEDPSLNYQFVNDPQRLSHLDNSEALLEQLREMGVSVNRDYLTLDIDFSVSGPNSLQDDASVGDHSADGNSDCLEQEGHLTCSEHGRTESEEINMNISRKPASEEKHKPAAANCGAPSNSDEDTGALATAGRFLRRLSAAEVPSNNLKLSVGGEPLSRLLSFPSHDEEVAEAHFTPDGNIKVIYDNLSKDYRSRVSSHEDHVKYLQLMDLDEQNPASNGCSNSTEEQAKNNRSFISLRSRLVRDMDGKLRRRLILVRRSRTLNYSSEFKDDFKRLASRVPLTLKQLPDRCKHKIRRLLAPDVGVDVSTPDSGVHESMAMMSPEEQERQNAEWEAELAKTEEEITTLRTVLASKVNHAHELKRRLGITVWKELSDDINQSLKTVRESQPYQKTAGAIGAVGEKTSSLFGGIGAKFGQLKETPTFKSFEERVGGVYTAARSKIPGGSGSNSTQDFEEAFKEAEGEKAAAEAAANNPTQDGMGVDPTQQQLQQQQPQQQSLA